ncbi:MAG: Gfo/Idh/MocA family oxidoreductase [Magnetococcales bacterium]|nr:Gfo/Idh/MocA family oxidoreductase [Magnetococcales bacterium]MBF0148974.1 Gfo/Idh/MocA family oxidoreductase [Magnetococcales bacterium]MBF0603040.1 Gfo/Idh/MocA family oxidoreductase [Magnetococcales bacterium]
MMNAAIIGAGAIALGRADGSPLPMIHLESYRALEAQVTLRAVVEPGAERRAWIAGIFPHLRLYQDMTEMFRHESIQVVSVCLPDTLHDSILSDLLRQDGVRGIWCEKPMAMDAAAARAIAKRSWETGIPVQVNFWRRFIPEMVALRGEIAQRRFGALHAVNGYYADGLIHNGSHLVDLVHFLVGGITPNTLFLEGPRDGSGDGPITIVGQVGQGASCVLRAIPRRRYNIFELELLFEEARVRVTENGRRLEYCDDRRDEAFPHLRILETTPRIVYCQWRGAFTRALAELLDAVRMDDVSRLSSGADSALIGVELLDRAQRLSPGQPVFWIKNNGEL